MRYIYPENQKLTRYNFALRQDQMDFLRSKAKEGFNMSAFVRILIDNAIAMQKSEEKEAVESDNKVKEG